MTSFSSQQLVRLIPGGEHEPEHVRRLIQFHEVVHVSSLFINLFHTSIKNISHFSC